MLEFIDDVEGLFGVKAKDVQLSGKVVIHDGQFDKAKDMRVIVKRSWS